MFPAQRSLQAWCETLFGVSWPKVIGIVAGFDDTAARELALIAGEEDAKRIRPGNPTGANHRTKKDGGIITT